MSVRRAASAVGVALLLASCGGGGGGGKIEPPRASPSGQVLVGDDLSANGAGWSLTKSASYGVAISHGALVVSTSSEGQPVTVVPDASGNDVFEAETAIELADDATGRGEVGVACRQTASSYYSFAVDGHTATISLWDDSTQHVLGTARIDAAPTRIAGRCLGGDQGGDTTLEMIVDGAQVLRAVDVTGLGPGASGVYARATSAKPLVLDVDRFEIRKLPGKTARQTPPPPFGPLPADGFSDSFDGTDGPFGTLAVTDDEGGFTARYDNGAYRLRADGFIQRSAPADPIPDHAVAEVTTMKDSKGPSWYGLRWAKDEDRYYEIAVDGDGSALIGFVDFDRDALVPLARADDVAAIHAGQPNKLRTEIDRTGEKVHLTLLVNDVPVLDTTDQKRWDAIHFSQVFIRSTSRSTEPTDVRFDDFSLHAL